MLIFYPTPCFLDLTFGVQPARPLPQPYLPAPSHSLATSPPWPSSSLYPPTIPTWLCRGWFLPPCPAPSPASLASLLPTCNFPVVDSGVPNHSPRLGRWTFYPLAPSGLVGLDSAALLAHYSSNPCPSQPPLPNIHVAPTTLDPLDITLDFPFIQRTDMPDLVGDD